MTTLASELKSLSSAEDFFAFFGLDFDPRVLAACRLHILKRFHDNLSKIEALDDMDERAQREAHREQLRSAYTDFATNANLTRRLAAEAQRMRGAFVALSAVRLPTRTSP
jgi:nitrogenase-stabilizing/protective protein